MSPDNNYFHIKKCVYERNYIFNSLKNFFRQYNTAYLYNFSS